jgi:hypothetical protein
VCLTNRPCLVDAIKWSEDNLIAVAAAHSVVITSPADMCGPRGHAAVDPNAQVQSTAHKRCLYFTWLLKTPSSSLHLAR